MAAMRPEGEPAERRQAPGRRRDIENTIYPPLFMHSPLHSRRPRYQLSQVFHSKRIMLLNQLAIGQYNCLQANPNKPRDSPSPRVPLSRNSAICMEPVTLNEDVPNVNLIPYLRKVENTLNTGCVLPCGRFFDICRFSSKIQ